MTVTQKLTQTRHEGACLLALLCYKRVSYEPTLRSSSAAYCAFLRGRGQRRRSEKPACPYFQTDSHGPDPCLQCRTGLHPLALSDGKNGSHRQGGTSHSQRRRTATHAGYVGSR